MEKRRFSLSLQPSLCSTSDASFIKSLFNDLELAAALRFEISLGPFDM